MLCSHIAVIKQVIFFTIKPVYFFCTFKLHKHYNYEVKVDFSTNQLLHVNVSA